jgi:CBS domain-containing protein
MLGKRMTIFVGEADQWHRQPLYVAILQHLKAADCAGATVTRGIAGFGAQSQIKTANILRLSIDLPVVITVVDAAEKIERLASEISVMLSAGLVIIDDTEIYFHSAAFRSGMPDVQVGDLMSTDPEAVKADTPIAEVVDRLMVRDYTALPVVDQGRHVIGMVADSDMLEAGITRLSVSMHKAIGPDVVREYLAKRKSQLGTVADAMRSPAVTVLPVTPIRDAAHLMHVHGLKRLPVVDEAGRLVGVLGRLDILRSIASGYTRRTTPQSASLPQQHRIVAEIMDSEVPVVLEDAPLADILGRLLDSKVKRVVVLDDNGRLVGVISDTDIVARIDPDERPGIITLLRSRWRATAYQQVRKVYGQRARDVMTTPAISVREDTPVIEALTLTVERHVKRLPVVDAAGRVLGTVSRPALLAASLDVAEAAETS